MSEQEATKMQPKSDYGYYPTYWSDLYALARKVLERNEEDWMPDGHAWKAIIQDFAKELDGAIEDRLHEWLQGQERERAERDMAAAEAMMPR